MIEGKTTSLHPAAVIASGEVASTAFGILGALLAVPASVVTGVLVNELWFRRPEEGLPWGLGYPRFEAGYLVR